MPPRESFNPLLISSQLIFFQAHLFVPSFIVIPFLYLSLQNRPQYIYQSVKRRFDASVKISTKTEQSAQAVLSKLFFV